jgi:hypothetical protein
MVYAVACLFVPLYELIELIATHMTDSGGVGLLDFRDLESALAVGAHWPDSLAALALGLPTQAQGVLVKVIIYFSPLLLNTYP